MEKRVVMSIEQLEEISLDVGYFEADQYIKKRDITLEDCIIAFDKTDNRNYRKELVNIWRLNKPFHEQSQETKDFIGDLILNK